MDREKESLYAPLVLRWLLVLVLLIILLAVFANASAHC
jgi:F0F1-type ATP synthase assembly protein I